MNLKTTIFLVILAGGCAALFKWGPDLAPRLGLASKPVDSSDAGTYKTLADLPANQVTKVEIEVPDQPKLVLQSPAAGQPLELPGNWPIRRYEVDELVDVLRDLKSRYHPIAIDDKTDLKPYGLADEQKPIAVTIVAPGETLKLKFGEAPLKNGENPFTRANYVRLEGKNEVLRLGPQVMPVLRRSEETYRRRQLFPEAIRARVAEPKKQRNPLTMMDDPDRPAATTFMLDEKAVKIAVDTPSGRFVLQRVAPLPKPEPPADKPDGDPVIPSNKLADSWIIVEPVKDHLDPDKVRAILTAIPNLWLEKFVEAPQGPDFLYGVGAHPEALPQLFTLLGGSIPNGTGDTVLRSIVNLASLSEAKAYTASITITYQDGSTRTLQFGRTARSSGGDDLRYAKIGNNPLVFELKSDKLNDLAISLSKPSTTAPSSPIDDLRDSSLVRFDADQVTGIEIVTKNGKDDRLIKLEKSGDEWKLQQPVADTADRGEVTELLNLLKGLEGRKGSIIDGAIAAPLASVIGVAAIDPKLLLGLTPDQEKKITLTFDAKSGLKPATYIIGRRDASANKRAVMVAGWDRINIVDERVDGQQGSRLDRQPSGYRSVKLFDPLARMSEYIVQRGAGDTYTIQEPADATQKWMIAAPFKAEADAPTASQLSRELSGLGNRKLIYDPATDAPMKLQWPDYLTSLGILAPAGDDLFGLAKPTLTITVKFSEPKGAADMVLEIGKARTDSEYYARLKGTTGVFVVPDLVVKAADHKAEDFVDKSLIQFAGKVDVQGIKRAMTGNDLEIAQNNSALWELTKPTQAKADQTTVDELVQQLTRLRAVRIESVTPKDLKEYGLEPPAATVTVEALEKGKLVEKVLLIGKPVDAMNPKGERFVKAQGSTMVAVLSAPLATRLVAESRTFRDLSLASFVSADKLTLERGDRKVTFVKGTGGWKVKEPLDADAEDEELRELHDLLARLRAEELVEDKPADLKEYGLDKPSRWRVFSGDKELLHLLVGDREKIGKEKKTDGFRAYAMLDKGNAVVLLDPLLTSDLLSEHRKRTFWEPAQPRDITEISITGDDASRNLKLKKGPTSWTDPATPAEMLNAELINELLLTVGLLRVDRYVVDKDAELAKYGLDKPRTLTITAEDGKKRGLLLGNLLDGKQLYAKFDDPARTDVFLLSERDTTTLNRPRADYGAKKDDLKKDDFKKADPNKDDPKKG